MERYRLISDNDGLEIGVAVERPQREPIAVLQISHGMCGCKERFGPVMKFMAENGIACIASDHRGHGESIRSIDDLGYMYKGGYAALVEDLRMVTHWGHSLFPGVPIFLLGHSMGSLAARLYVRGDDSELAGVIICGSPSWNPMAVLGRMLTGGACMIGFGKSRPQFIQKMISGKYNTRFESEGEQAWTCSDPEVRKEFRENPLCNFHFTMNGAHNLLSMMCETYSTGAWNISQPMMPVIFLSGSDDPCMITERKFHRAAYAMIKAGYRNVSSVLFPQMRHEILNEKEKETVWKEILDFISKSCRKGYES